MCAEYKDIWQQLFMQVFGPAPLTAGSRGKKVVFPLVEINVRHFLREIVKYYLGGDEYLNPTRIDEKCSADVDSFWQEFGVWLHAVHDVAVTWRKKLILKMPHRSDTLSLVALCGFAASTAEARARS